MTSFRKLSRIYMCTIAMLLMSLSTFAQQPVTGTIRSTGGDPLPGATVSVKNSETSSTASTDGRFSIQAKQGDSLIFSYVGYTSQTIRVGEQLTFDVRLESTSQDLNQVVVVGYGAQRKRDLTGAVAVVSAGDVKMRQATTLGEALQGLASGVAVRAGGRPGSEARVEIRGLKNLQGANPLYVIDGMITTANRDFNPNDIESVQILKDASAAAIYGSRAANGVIIITTRKGKKGPMRVDFSAKTSVQKIPRYELAETEEFSKLNYMAYDNANVARQNLDLSNNTNWQDEAFQVGNMQDYNVAFSGGSDYGSFLISANYFGNKGTVISTDFKRYSVRINSQGSKGIFSVGENIAISNGNTDEMSGNPIADVVRLLPTIPVRNTANPGGYGYGSESRARTFGTNPVAIANLEDRTNENLRIRGNLWTEIKIASWLRYRLNLGYETSSDHYKYLRKEGNWTLNQAYDPAILNENRARFESRLVENTLTFNKEFGKHKVNAVVGQTYQQDKYEQIWGTKRNIIRNSLGQYYDVLDQGNEPQTGGFGGRGVLLSYLGRVEYNFDDKYLVNGVIRRDGSSRLGRNNQWGTFPSVSAAWRISKENFFKVDWISDLKIRGSWGILGTSSNIQYWDYLPIINTFSTMVVGRDQHVEPGGIQVRLANKDLRWEELTQTNIGLDADLFNSRFSFTAEYFIAKTSNVLVNMPIALTTGNDGGAPTANAANLKNTGFEISATYRSRPSDFKYYATANVTTLKNRVLALGYGRNDIYVGNTVTKLGQPIGMWYVLQTDGLFQSQADIDSYKNKDGKIIQPGAKPGDVRFRDNDGDGQITNTDKVVVSSPWANWELGLNLGASYKSFDLTMNWFGSFGATVYNGYYSLVDRFDDNSNYRSGISPWTPDNTKTSTPRAFYGSTLNSRGDSDRWLEDGSFMRLKLITLAYNFPERWLKRIGFSTGQLSLSGQNLITFTKYNGLDPEFNNGSLFERGYDNFSFPNLKMYSLGLQFGF